jgi:hypothetical protein
VAAPIFATEAVLDRASVIPEADEEERLSVFRDFVNSLGADRQSRQGEEGPGRPRSSLGPAQEQLADDAVANGEPDDGPADPAGAGGDDPEPVA